MTPEELFEKLKNIPTDHPLCKYTLERCSQLAPLIEEINQLKKEKNALILAHSYVHPDIIYGVADHVGDSFGLSKIAKETSADIIVFPAVRFMAETAKILNPDKIVLDPNPNGGCSLADSIDADTVHHLRGQHPEHTFVCYINTTAAVKAACDICVTSSNALHILTQIPRKKIYFLPDRLMGQNLSEALKKKGIDKELLYYSGSCYVHEQFSSEEVAFLKKQHPTAKVLAHPECSPDVARQADLITSTSGIIDYVKANATLDSAFLILTECGISTRLQAEHPHLQMIGSCRMCRYMKSNHLKDIANALRSPSSYEITLDPTTHSKALKVLLAMFEFSQN